MAYKIAVIGAGVNGLASALCLTREFPDSEISVIASEFYPQKKNLCSAHGFGIVVNCGTGALDGPDFTKHVLATMQYCASLHPREAEYAGIRPRDAVLFFNQNMDDSVSMEDRQKLGFRDATKKEIETFARMNNGGKDPLKIYICPVYVIDTSRYLPWLIDKLLQNTKKNGEKMVRFVTNEVKSFAELSPEFDLIVNCSGCGAGTLAGDANIVPIRGQYMKVNAPFVDKVYITASTAICPRHDHVAIGTIIPMEGLETHVTDAAIEKMLYEFETILPHYGKVEKVSSDIGIRPGRVGGARLEVEMVKVHQNSSSEIPKSSSEIPVIHNYGHGYGGISQHWGCALGVAQIALHVLRVESKL